MIVECQNPLDSVDVHGGNQPRIVNLNPGHSARDDQFLMHSQAVGKNIQRILDHRSARIRFFDAQSVPFRSVGLVHVFQNSARFCEV